MSLLSFEKNKSEEIIKRRQEVEQILKRYPDRIPVIVERMDKNVPEIDKKKFLIPSNNMTVGEFFYVIRKRLRLAPEKTLYLFVKNTLLPQSELMSVVYKNYKGNDNYLTLYYGSENTFG